MNKCMEEKLILPEDAGRILCAVSGGADSVCLLYALAKLAPQRGFVLCAAHYEHGLRGEESLRDAAFVQQVCRSLGLELMVEHGDVPAYAAKNGLGTEEAARELRYDFLERAAKKLNCDYIATAHNADDNAETMLFNLARGTGGKGLQGIPYRRGNIIRPLLGVTRAEIETYLRDNAIEHVEDSSNALDDYSRNLIRHRVMPVLRDINPGFARAAARTAELLARDDDFITGTAREFIAREYDGESVSASAIAALHPAVASRVVRLLWDRTLGREHVSAVLALVNGGGLAYADVPGGRIRREQGRIYFAAAKAVEIPPRVIVPGEELHVPEAGVKISAYFTEYSEEIYCLFKNYCLKCESICGNLVCTGRQPGDKLSIASRGCTKSLKQLFTENHMTQRQRDMTVVLRDDKGVAAVAGFGADKRMKPQPGDRVLCIKIEKDK